MTRVLFLGENWFGSCARACCYALRRLGCDVWDVDAQTIFPQVRRKTSKLLRKTVWGRLVREYNDLVLSTAASFKPDVLLAFKGAHVLATTLQALRSQGVALYNYYPDTSAFAHGPLLEESLPEYDCIFSTKRFLIQDVSKRRRLRDAVFLPHGYDPEIHRPWELDERDFQELGCDVTVIATYMPHKEALLAELVKVSPRLELRIWGNGWERSRSPGLRPHIMGVPLNGISYAKAIRASRINLAIMSGIVAQASQGDETTTRTYEVPASGGFMLHERSPELLQLFKEDDEVTCFSAAKEAADKIAYYLLHPEERARIAAAGYARCVPAYSYDNRMARLLEWHRQHCAQSVVTA